MEKLILGINAVGHDSSVIYYNRETGDIFALDNERVTRVKHDGTSITGCLRKLLDREGRTAADTELDLNEIYDNEEAFTLNYLLQHKLMIEIKKVYGLSYVSEISEIMNLPRREKIRRMIRKIPYSWRIIYLTFLVYLLRIFSVATRHFKTDKFNNRYSINNLRRYVTNDLKTFGFRGMDINFYDHHLTHCIAAYYFSPFNRCLSVSLDFSGDGYFSKIYLCSDGEMKELITSPVIYVDHNYLSIGRVYSAVTAYLGLVPNSDEGKVEALAAYGRKENGFYYDLMNNVSVSEDFRISLNEVIDRFLTKAYLDEMLHRYGREGIAAAVQGFLEDFFAGYMDKVMRKYGVYDVCFSGGTFANVKLNMAIYEGTSLKNQYIFPAMSDSGSAVGALILRLKEEGVISPATFKQKRYRMPYWGVEYSEKDIKDAIDRYSAFVKVEHLREEWPEAIAALVCDGKIGAIFQGRSEYGPRALGNRSILADARREDSRDRLNKVIKGRPPFQPFCPSILEEHRKEMFERSYPNKHMTCAFRLKEQYFKKFPSGAHVDGTARPQFVEEDDNPNFYRVLKETKKIIGEGMLINTSFNKHGRTMALTPEDAIIDFMDSKMDFCCVNGYLMTRKD